MIRLWRQGLRWINDETNPKLVAPIALSCTLLAACGGPGNIQVTNISPDFCSRKIAKVTETIGKATVAESMDNPFKVVTRRDEVVYGGMPEENKILIKHYSEGVKNWDRVIDLENPSMSFIPYTTRYWDMYNFRGKNGELYYWLSAFYIVIYSATSDKLEYELHQHDCDKLSCKHVPCPESR